RPAPYRVRRGGERVTEPRAGGVDVERPRGVDAEPVGHAARGVGDLGLQRARRDDHQVDVARGQPARGQRLAARLHRQVDLGLLGTRDPAFDDADPGADPLVAGVHGLGEVLVGHHVGGLVAAERQHPRAGGALDLPHLPVSSLIRSRAASRSSGVFSATVRTPRRARLARPVSVPPGTSSIIAVTPSSAIVFMHRSHRTGPATWSISRRRNSVPVPTTAPSAFCSSRVRGSAGVTAAAALRSWSTAGAMWWVWNAPATESGMSRARAGG